MALNNWFHDFSVAVLVACLLVVWWLGRPGAGVPAAVQRSILRRLGPVTVGCWVFLALAGAVRTWGYREYEWAPAAGRGQLVALAVKHAVLGSLVVIGAVAHWRLARRLKP